ncbi:hypothetical protein RvY_03439-2 [Ramazzottius varieornatus]|uniref:PLAC domain-containing protein n=1 Tax=Ramazzottius varieornatus TaxID=947166 RepID=A0A1D1UN43_RAMVA|nr:hypothetical protein RvY_03439-2 [Ramazzottius varieornatus]
MEYSAALLLAFLAIGCDGIIGSVKRVDACGICQGDGSNCQKIKMEFTEENLPRGHNKIGTIPRGACNITLTEQRPSGNVFALRTTQGFFLNGEWTASPTGQYGAAGTVFNYQHVTNGNSLRRHGERVTAKGPLTSDIDIVLVTKTRNVGVTLEYTISNDRSNIPSRRHRADNYIDVPNAAAEVHRGDIPSIAEDFVETPLRVEALPTTTQRPPERFRWTVAGYSACSRTCGKGVKHSTIACMLDGAERRIVDDRYCANVVRPATFQEQCNLPSCPGEWAYGEWSQCSVTCGAGTETRQVRCRQAQSDGVMADVSDDVCGSKPSQGIIRPCQRPACSSYSWRSGQWSPCDASCGRGSQQRMVKCYDNTYGMEVSDEQCRGSKPAESQACEGGSCRGIWLMSDWAPKCSNGCGQGETTRHVVCYKDGRQQDARKCDATQRPQTRQTCHSQKDCGGRWYEGPWSDCSADCGVGSQTRDVICLRARDYERAYNPQCEVLDESECKYHPKPESRRQCQGPACHAGSWYMSDWSPCSHSCGVGARSRQVTCLDHNKNPSNDCPDNSKPTSMESCGNDICTQDDYYPRRAQSSQPSSFIPRPPVDLNNKAGTLYDAAPQQDYRGPIDLNNKAGTLYDAAPQQDYRPPIDLNNKAGTLYDAAPQADYRPPIDLNNKAGTLYDAAPQQDYRGPIDLNNKAGTLYDAAPQQDYRPPIDLNNKAGTLYDAAPQADYRPPIDLNNKAGTLYDAAPQQDYRPPIDLNNKAGTLYDAAPQQDYRPPIDLNNKAGTLYDAAPQADYRPPVDLNNKAGTLYDAAPQADYRPPIDLNNKAGTLYDAAAQQDYRPAVDLNNKAATLYDAAPQEDYRPPIDLNNKAGTLYDTQAPARRTHDTGRRGAEGHNGPMPPAGSKRRAVASPSGMVDIDVTPRRSRKRTEAAQDNTVTDHAESGSSKRDSKLAKNGTGHGKTCTDRMERCKTVKELAFCRYDYYKKMCCKSCSA